jgi:hypothetical protein
LPAKKRGWGKRTEVTGAGGGPLTVKMYDFDVSKYPPPVAEAVGAVVEAEYDEPDEEDGNGAGL